MPEAQPSTPPRELHVAETRGTGSSGKKKPPVNVHSIIARLQRYNQEKPLDCVRTPYGTKTCERQSQGGIALAKEVQILLQSPRNEYSWGPHIESILRFLHCKEHWETRGYCGQLTIFWGTIELTTQAALIEEAGKFINLFCSTYEKDYCNDSHGYGLGVLAETSAVNLTALSDFEESPLPPKQPNGDRKSSVSACEDDECFVNELQTLAHYPNLDPPVPITPSPHSRPSLAAPVITETQGADRDTLEPSNLPENGSTSSLGRSSMPVDDLIESEMTRRLGRTGKLAKVYIFTHKDVTDDPNTRLLKVGYTADSKIRMRAVSCREMREFFSTKVPNARRVEQLAHKELSNFRREYRCCEGDFYHSGKSEWYAVGAEEAAEVLRHWVKFMQHEPYGRDGSLKGLWAARLASSRKTGASNDNNERVGGPKTRHDRWQKFVSITITDIIWHYASLGWKAIRDRLGWLCEYNWQFTSASLAFWLCCIALTRCHFVILMCIGVRLVWEGSRNNPGQTGGR